MSPKAENSKLKKIDRWKYWYRMQFSEKVLQCKKVWKFSDGILILLTKCVKGSVCEKWKGVEAYGEN